MYVFDVDFNILVFKYKSIQGIDTTDADNDKH